MRAKMTVQSVENFGASEKVKFICVGQSAPYGPNGESEDNTFARYTPSGSAEYQITNPALAGSFKPGQKFYVDFTPAE
jgi:hypothetical protein